MLSIRTPQGVLTWGTLLLVAVLCFTPPSILESIDYVFYYRPQMQFLRDALFDLRLPLWNPYQLCGVPWLGSPLGGLFYPPHVLYLVLPTHLALAASGLLHLLWIALSTAWFVRRVGVGVAPAALAGVLYALRGMMPGDLFLAPCRLEAASWLPLGCLAVLDLVRARRAEILGGL
jgi:hypothetical protein